MALTCVAALLPHRLNKSALTRLDETLPAALFRRLIGGSHSWVLDTDQPLDLKRRTMRIDDDGSISYSQKDSGISIEFGTTACCVTFYKIGWDKIFESEEFFSEIEESIRTLSSFLGAAEFYLFPLGNLHVSEPHGMVGNKNSSYEQIVNLLAETSHGETNYREIWDRWRKWRFNELTEQEVDALWETHLHFTV
jgi:hypothetical protein